MTIKVEINRLDVLLYDSQPGDHISDVVDATIRYGFGGFVHNGKIIRRDESDTAETLAEKWRKGQGAA